MFVPSGDNDVKANTNRLDFDGSSDLLNMSISLIVDSIAQERPEYFNITLDLSASALDSYSKMAVLSGTVIDSDRKYET